MTARVPPITAGLMGVGLVAAITIATALPSFGAFAASYGGSYPSYGGSYPSYGGTYPSTGGTTGTGTGSTSTTTVLSSGSATIGTSGGSVSTSDGSVTLQIPANAFSTQTQVTVDTVDPSTLSVSMPSGDTSVGAAFEISAPTEPSTPVKVTLKLNQSALGNMSTNRVGVFYLDPTTGQWLYEGGSVNSASETVTLTINHFSTYATLANLATFPDVPSGFWARPYIDTLLGANAINGLANGTFDPNGTVTRAEFVKMVVQALGLPTETGATSLFADVSQGSWEAPYVAAAYNAGITKGITPTEFGVNQPITREQEAVLLARAFKLQGTAPVTFKDAGRISSWAQNGVAAAVASHVISGYTNGTFAPLQSTTRAQSAAMIARALQAVGLTTIQQ